MEEYASAIIVGLGGALASILGAYALVVRARASAAAANSKPRALLQGLWYWLEGRGLDGDVPKPMAARIKTYLDSEDRDDDATV